MSLWRWIAITGLSCLALAAAYLPPQPEADHDSRSEAPSRQESRLNLLNGAFRRTEDLLKLLHLRDSLRTAVRAAGSRMADVEVVIRDELPAQWQAEFRVAVDRVWQRSNGSRRARLLVLLEAARTRPYWPPIYVLPVALDGRTCAVSLTLDWPVPWLRNLGSVEHGANLQSWLLDALGPCLYYTTFGQPGPQIEAWLKERGFKIANAADWNTAPRTLSVREDPQMLDQLVSNSSFDALACGAGQLPRCRNAVEHINNLETFRVRTSVLPIAGVVRRTLWPRNFALDDHYLESLVHDMGRDRFSRFWRSAAPVDSAFLVAFGQPMEVWTARWARAFAPDLPPVGPAPRPVAVLFGFALGAIAVIAATALVLRRQVS